MKSPRPRLWRIILVCPDSPCIFCASVLAGSSRGKPRSVAESAPQVHLSTFILLVSGRYSKFHDGLAQLIWSRGRRLAPSPPPTPSPVLRAVEQWGAPSGELGRSAVRSLDRAAFGPREALPRDLSFSSALLTSVRCFDFRDGPTWRVLCHVLCFALSLPPLARRASSVWPQIAPNYVAALRQRSSVASSEGLGRDPGLMEFYRQGRAH
ncbi:hypothetical protein NDU88_006600 [Pleurodeles waltl]|uniref:Uncharacterized protein n=1 Tax=Pleurodeles waltl TaxID=8319 RepID=A0AAV7ULG7_PLEWA|nr:hypothetical protein NDU88_006600 [Pleurodeles waltl]